MPFPSLLALTLLAQQPFTTQLIPLEGQVRGVKLVDLDRDGELDALVEKTNALAWLAGDGAGGFAAPRLVSGGAGWKPLTFGELDGDGWLDALAIRTNPAELVFVRGDANGGFLAPVSLATGDFLAVDAVDLDGDGELDVVAWERVTRSLRTFRQVAGAWIPLGGAVLPNADVLALAADDFDRDGAADVALSFSLAGPLPQPRLAILHGDGNGGFGQRWSQPFELAFGLDSADLDGDGAPELVATTAAKVHALRHQGQRHYSVSALASVFQSKSELGDADSDGDIDLLVATPEGARLHRNDGLGRFSQFVNLFTHPSAGGFDLADLDGDGAAEIVGPAGQGWIARTSSNGQGGWDDLHVGRSIASRPIAAGDFDGDGIEDLLLDMGSKLEFARGNGQGELVPALQIPLSASNGSYAADLRDLDADGDLDVLLRQWTGSYEFLANDGAGQFAAPAALPMPTGLELDWADFDGDGVDDALSHSGASLTLYRGLPGGGFAPPIATPHPNVLVFRALADIDGDGACEAVLVRPGVRLEIWSCGANGTFVLRSSAAVAGSPEHVAAGDFDGDGFGDVAWVERAARLVRCARGSAAGTLAAPVDSALHMEPDAGATPLVRDLDGDGLPDLVLRTTPATAQLRPEVRLSLGGGRFSRPAKFATGATSGSLVLLDVNGDGRRDLVADNLYVSRPLVLLQR
ncbi:MAG: VCBS repeat-containing protein [Planctomycetota bacterium]|nr:VCBS repeat-containing protein [Planctomycetota bacterium]